MIDVDPNIFVFWKLSWMPCKLRCKNQSVQRLSVNILTRWLLDSDIQILLNIGQSNGFLPDDTKSLFKPMFTHQWWSHVTFTWGQYHWARGIMEMLKISVVTGRICCKIPGGMIYNKLHLYFEVFGYWIHSAQSSEKCQPFLPVHGEDRAIIIDL